MPLAFGGNNQSGQIDVATACNACASASGRMDFETETFLVQPTHTLRGEGFDAGEDGTGRGTPLVPHVVGALACNTGPNGHDAGNFACNQAVDAGHVLPVAFAIQAGALRTNPLSGPDGLGVQADHAYTLEARAEVQAVAVPVGVTIHGTDPTVQKVASYDELAQCLRARTPGNIDNSSTTVVQQPVAYGIRTANTSSNGWGIQEECTHTLDCAQGVAVAFHPTQDPISSTDGSTHALGCGSTGGQASVAVAVALRGRDGGATAELGDEVQNCLRASGGGVGPVSPTLRSVGHDGSHANAGGQVAVAFAQNSRDEVRLMNGDGQIVGALAAEPGMKQTCYVAQYSELETLYNKGFNTLKEGNASTQETYPGTLLRTLRQEVGEEAFAKWGLGILDSLQQAEVLRQALHGLSIRPASFSRSWVVHCALSRSQAGSGWLLQSLREAGIDPSSTGKSRCRLRPPER